MSQKNLDKKSVSPKRRALIKGSATAMPMVLTLRSGSAFAAVSIADTFTCNDLKPSAHPNSVTMNMDEWKRVETLGRNVLGIGPMDIVFLDPRRFDAERWFSITENNITGTPYITKTKDDGTIVMVAESDASNPNATEYTPSSSEFTCYALVHVTSEGKWTKVVGYDKTGSLPFTTTSCYNSMYGV